jgi:hypothetical protein
MATTNKDFKVKYGLVVEGASALVNGNQVLTEDASDAYILGLTGGATLVKSVSNQFDVSVGGELSLDRTVVDAYYDAAGDAAAAQAAAELTASGDATTKANAAQAAAELTASGDATTKANAAQAAAELTASGDATTKANAAEQNAKDYADDLINDGLTTSTNTWSAYKTSTEIGLAEDRAKEHADEAVAELVGSAPELLDTLQELAAALDNDPDTINSLQSIAAGKQDELTPGANIDITGATISVTGLDTADVAEDSSRLYFTNQRALDATSAAYDAAGSAATAETNAIAHADALTTDDVAEGTTQYFTDARAKTSAADLLVGAAKTNITITGNGSGLTITAENGVADSDTDDLTEGTSNLYFTDERAVDALEAVVPNFTAVEINSLAKQIASTVSVATASQVTAYEFLATEYRSAKFLVKTAYGSHTELTEVLLTLDQSNNIAITEYATVGTNGSSMTVTADYVSVGETVRLRVTTLNNTSVVTVVGTLLA